MSDSGRCHKHCECECCRGTAAATPAPIYNRPGLDELSYRVGEHGAFLQSMKARLSSSDFPALKGLGARDAGDPSIAILDGWATVADILTFYQERLANEGYLRTATERRSILELARLIGYTPRPGVSSTVYVAYEIDPNATEPVEIPLGSKVQSVPGPGELPQTFETDEKFLARKEWNAIRPRLERPQTIERILYGPDEDPGARLYLKGTSTGLKPNDALLIQLMDLEPGVVRVTEVAPDSALDRTLVRFETWNRGTVRAPGQLRLRRTAEQFARIRIGQQAPGSVARRVLTELAAFIGWLAAEASRESPDPEVTTFLNEPVPVDLTFDAIDDLRRAALQQPESLLARTLKASVKIIDSLAGEIAEYTGLSGGGVVGAHTDELAARMAAIKPGSAPASPDDVRLALLMRSVLQRLNTARSVPPRNAASLEQKPETLFDRNSDVGVRAAKTLAPMVANELDKAIANLKVSGEIPIRVYALRQRSLLFASSAPPKVTGVSESGVVSSEEWSDTDIGSTEDTFAIHLELPNERIKEGEWVVLDYTASMLAPLGRIQLPKLQQESLFLARAGKVQPRVSRAAYGVAGQTTRIPLRDASGIQGVQWFTLSAATNGTAKAFPFIRNMMVYVQSEELPLALEPMTKEICGGDDWVEVDGLFSGLEPGRWLVVAGDRSDVPETEGVKGSELVMLEAVRHDVERSARQGNDQPPAFEPGEKLHTYLKLAAPLSYCYKRAGVTINANVVKASHGDARTEILGSGNAAQPLQKFQLRQPPLTYVPANEPDGIASTLRIYVDNVEWKESPALVAMGPTARMFMTRTNDDATTTVVFGDGRFGARIPTGLENVKAVYRSGIGKGGNVRAGQISQLLSRPLGVKGVNNPMEASGGADRETRDQARRNAPLAVMSLDRLVGIRDYADFTRTFAGIGKAVSSKIASGGSERIYVTIAGAEDVAVPESSDLYRNLLAALRTYGDPALGITVQSRDLLVLVLVARVWILSDYLWEDVSARTRAALLDRYSFERRDLGQSVVLSDVVATVQNVRGVQYVDIDALGAVSQLTPDGELRSPQELAAAAAKVVEQATTAGRPAPFVKVEGIRRVGDVVKPAQLACLIPSLQEMLVLNRIEDEL